MPDQLGSLTTTAMRFAGGDRRLVGREGAGVDALELRAFARGAVGEERRAPLLGEGRLRDLVAPACTLRGEVGIGGGVVLAEREEGRHGQHYTPGPTRAPGRGRPSAAERRLPWLRI